jgi:RNA polymerase sigma factor (sigma-70 family)
MTSATVEDLLRTSAPQVLATLVQRYGQFDTCEDAVQEALAAAVVQWPRTGIPDNPRAWLLTVATRWLVDHWRSDHARRRRESTFAALEPILDDPIDGGHDDTLTLLFLCCHPALPPPSQIALTLRAVGGLTTAEIASAFLVPEPTMAKRVSRAKHTIRTAGARFEAPPTAQLADRIRAVEHVLYLIFNEGYTASAGPTLHRPDLTTEAIRLTRLLHRILPHDGEVAGLLALMLLTDARRPARTDDNGWLIPLDEQRREKWDTAAIAEGLALLHRTLGTTTVGPYQVQAAIAALHDEAPTADQTDWPQILALYNLLDTIAPGPLATLSRAVAVAHVHGPTAALAVVGTLEDRDHPVHSHRVEAVRAHLLEQSGQPAAARAAYERAARATASRPEQLYLTMRAANLREPGAEEDVHSG